jgi:hypothetical protein
MRRALGLMGLLGPCLAFTVAMGEESEQAKARDLGIPTTGSTRVAVRDLYGKAVQAKVAAGTVTVTLSGSPQYIDLSGRN